MTEVGYATLIGDLGFPGLFQPIKIQILCSKTILVILNFDPRDRTRRTLAMKK